MNFYPILPNIWICYINPEYIQSINKQPTQILREFTQKHNVTKLIKSHKDLAFFGKSQQYIDLIKEQMEKDEIKKMYAYLLNTSKNLFDYYLQGDNTLIISGTDIYKALSIIIAFLVKYADMNIQQSFTAIASKIPLNLSFSMIYQKTFMLIEKMNKNTF